MLNPNNPMKANKNTGIQGKMPRKVENRTGAVEDEVQFRIHAGSASSEENPTVTAITTPESKI